MMFFINGGKTLRRHMRVDLRGGKAHMAQQFLHRPQIRSVVQQMGGKGVPDGVGAHMLLQAVISTYLSRILRTLRALRGRPRLFTKTVW